MAILDVGGFQRTFPEATHIIDVMPKDVNCTREYVQQDICETPWPYKDKEFDFVYCSNVLEDIKDPVRVCKEMIRVGKRGRISGLSQVSIPFVHSRYMLGTIKALSGRQKRDFSWRGIKSRY